MFSLIKDIKHIKLGHATGLGSGGAQGAQKFICFEHGHVAYQIDRDDIMTSRTVMSMQVKFSPSGQTGDLRVRSKGQISLNFKFSITKSISKIFMHTCMY